ncbi:MAG TPA: DUF4136 domain-containing protein [Flavisolibacter sp.]|nr:DUF4136 domain-containing protein [Flavisolibacter sp.]
MTTMKNMVLAGLASVLVWGCSNPVYVQSDESVNLAKYKTYMWVQTRSNQDDNRNVTAFADQNVRSAVNAQLAKEGWTEVNQNPDALVSYDILVERSNQQQSDPVYSQPFSRIYYNPYTRRWGTLYYPSQFMGYDTYTVPVHEATLTITMMDPNTDKSLWQAWTTETMHDRKFTTDEINKGVRKIFKKFNPGR